MSSWTGYPPRFYCRASSAPPSSYPPTTPVPASERPTLVAIPRAPRAPEFPEVYVPEMRYDLEDCTAGAAYFGPARARELERALSSYNPYAGLSSRECALLGEARVELVNWAKRLGQR